MSSEGATGVNANEYAYYVSDWIWPNERINLMKSMLLFFDKITLALPDDLSDEVINRDQELAVPLANKGLLVNMDPSKTLDGQTAKRLAKTISKLVTQDLRWEPRRVWIRPQLTITPYHYGAFSLGRQAAHHFEVMLERRGLMRSVKNANLVQLDPSIRLMVLTIFAQVFRAQLLSRGTILHPVTDSPELAHEMRDSLFYNAKSLIGHDNVVGQLSADLVDVGTDLSDVPLDEILDFRQENKAHYFAYAADLRKFLAEQISLSPAEQRKAKEQRRLLIQAQASELKAISRKAFGIRASALLFGLAGATWTALHGDNLGSILAGLTATASAIPPPEPTITVYSYLLRTRKLG